MGDQQEIGHARQAAAPLLHELRERLLQQCEAMTEIEHSAGDVEERMAAAMRTLQPALDALQVAERDMHRLTSELDAANSKCERERRRYADLFELCPEPYLVTDVSWHIREANYAAIRLVELPNEQIIAHTVHDLVHPEDREAFRKRLEELPHRKHIDDWEIRFQVAEARTIPVSISVALCGQNRNEIRWLIRDLTDVDQDRMEMQQMREEIHRSERMTAIGTLAAGLGHDVKNLLFPMRCRLDSLAASDLPSQAVQDVEGIRHAVGYLQQLANNLQLMAERPDPSLTVQGTTELQAWWEHVVPLMRTATRASVQVDAKLGPDLPPINIAPHLLTQAVMNLINNASEVMAEGGRITVWANRSKHGPFIKLGVTDEGPGMAPEVLRRALDPFFTTKPRGRGISTGMGLSLVRSIIKNVAGSVRVDSTPGAGTTVILRLPIAVESDQAKAGAGQSVAYAAVSVSDSHLAATMCTLLNLSRMPSWRSDPHDPGDCKLWIVEPTSIPINMAREYLRTDKSRRLILCGKQEGEWRNIAADWIDPSASLPTIRDVLSQAAFAVLQKQ